MESTGQGMEQVIKAAVQQFGVKTVQNSTRQDLGYKMWSIVYTGPDVLAQHGLVRGIQGHDCGH